MWAGRPGRGRGGPPRRRAARAVRAALRAGAAAGAAASAWTAVRYWSVLVENDMEGGAGEDAADGPSVSVVVPVLNEEKCISDLVRQLHALRPTPAEILIIDGGSSDATGRPSPAGRAQTSQTNLRRPDRRRPHGAVRTARAAGGVRVLRAKRGRAKQMNAGVAAAAGEIVLFLHADTALPRDGVAVVRRTMADRSLVLAAFVPRIEMRGERVFWLISLHNVLKTFYLPLVLRPKSFFRGMRCFFGDQAMFCRTADFRKVGGFEESLPIMEDAQLCIKMSRLGGMRLVPRVVSTSGRRWVSPTPWPTDGAGRASEGLTRMDPPTPPRIAKMGNAKATAVHFLLGLSWYFGASPSQLDVLYRTLYPDTVR